MDLSCNNIIYSIPPFDSDDDLIDLKASNSITTHTIKDTCNNERIVFPCNPDDCGCDGCEDGENPCKDKCTQFKTDVCIEGDLSADDIHANKFYGDGCNVENTDDTKVTSFEYTSDDNLITLKTYNEACECKDVDPKPVCNENIFTIDTEPFEHDTKVVDFKLPVDSDILCITTRDEIDNSEEEFCVDLERYNNKNEQFVVKGDCSNDGIITFCYNLPEKDCFEVDISNAVHGIPADGEYNKCTGDLTLIADNGNTLVIDGFPVNYTYVGEIPLQPEWGGHVYYYIKGNSIMVNVNVQLSSNIDPYPGNNLMPSYLGKLPVNFPDFVIYKWLHSFWALSDSHVKHIQLKITPDGMMYVSQYTIPEIIQDSFTLLFTDITDPLICQNSN